MEVLLQLNLNEKKEKYIEVFKSYRPDLTIEQKRYDVTMIRSLIMYFLYQEKKVGGLKSAKHTKICEMFNLGHHSTVVKAIDKVEEYIECINDETFKKHLEGTGYLKEFSYFYFRFQKVFVQYKCIE